MNKSQERSAPKAQSMPAEPGIEPDASNPRNDQGIVRDELGQEQPRDKERAQQVSRVDHGGDPPGEKA
jgi:hypothetical protein